MKILYNTNRFKFKPKEKKENHRNVLQPVRGKRGSLNQSGYINAV